MCPLIFPCGGSVTAGAPSRGEERRGKEGRMSGACPEVCSLSALWAHQQSRWPRPGVSQRPDHCNKKALPEYYLVAILFCDDEMDAKGHFEQQPMRSMWKIIPQMSFSPQPRPLVKPGHVLLFYVLSRVSLITGWVEWSTLAPPHPFFPILSSLSFIVFFFLWDGHQHLCASHLCRRPFNPRCVWFIVKSSSRTERRIRSSRGANSGCFSVCNVWQRKIKYKGRIPPKGGCNSEGFLELTTLIF